MRYVSAFDVAHQPFENWGFFVSGVGLVCGATLALIFLCAPKVLMPSGERRTIALVVGVLFTLLSAFWALQSREIIRENNEAISAAASCSTIEGRVEDFQPMPYGGHPFESFTVSGVHFSYSDYVETAGFNNTSSHGGPIREGLPVRICHAGGLILKLEIGS